MNVLFDLDGTLCDPREGILRGFAHAFSAMGLPLPDEELAVAQIGRPLEACFKALGCGQGSAAAARHFQEFFEARGFAEGRLYDGVLECLAGLRKEGWGLAVASSKPSFVLQLIAADLGLRPYLQGLYGCAPEDLNPDKCAIVAEALRDTGWPAAGTVLVGDRAQDRDAAAAHGLVFIAAGWGFGSPEEHSGAWTVAGAPSHLPALLKRLAGLPGLKP